ncbi:MAG: DUF2842 domain-containing protein [Vitreimonas sp.]
MHARTRKAFGCFLLLAYLAGYAAIAATLGAYIWAHAPHWTALIYYAAAGVIWVLPLKPLFSWMNRGA